MIVVIYFRSKGFQRTVSPPECSVGIRYIYNVKVYLMCMMSLYTFRLVQIIFRLTATTFLEFENEIRVFKMLTCLLESLNFQRCF